jgi:hypothetical protein
MDANISRRLDLLACALVSALAILLSVAGWMIPPVRLLLGVPLALFMPGYSLIALLFPRTGGAANQMRMSTRVMFSLGTSISLAILCSVVLNFTPFGIQPLTLTFVLSLLTLVLVVAADRRLGEVQHAYRPSLAEQLAARGFGPLQAALLGISGLVATGAVVYSVLGARQNERAHVVQLWMLPVENATPGTLRFGMRNVSSASSAYRLELQRSGDTLKVYDAISAPPGVTWEITATLGVEFSGIGSGPISAVLYDARDPSTPIRRVQYFQP